MVRHALKNSLILVVSLIGLQLPLLFGGTVVIEQIFAAERVPTYAGTPVTVRPDQQILFQGDD